MSYTCYKIYVNVYVYCKLFMLTKYIQSSPNKENLDIWNPIQLLLNVFINTMIQPINSFWHLPAPLVRTRVSPLWLVRSQQLCRGTGHTGLTLKLCSNGNKSLRLIEFIINTVSRRWMPPYQKAAELLCNAAVWWGDIRIYYTYYYYYQYERTAHRNSTNSPHDALNKIKFQFPSHFLND